MCLDCDECWCSDCFFSAEYAHPRHTWFTFAEQRSGDRAIDHRRPLSSAERMEDGKVCTYTQTGAQVTLQVRISFLGVSVFHMAAHAAMEGMQNVWPDRQIRCVLAMHEDLSRRPPAWPAALRRILLRLQTREMRSQCGSEGREEEEETRFGMLM